MKRFIVIFAALMICAAFVGCGIAPEIRAAHAKQQEALLNVKENLTTFAVAALADLQGALIEQVDREFAARKAALIDAEGKVLVADYDAELAAAEAARDLAKAQIGKQIAGFQEIMQDLDGSIAVGAAIDKYLNRPTFTTGDAVNLMGEIADILKQ